MHVHVPVHVKDGRGALHSNGHGGRPMCVMDETTSFVATTRLDPASDELCCEDACWYEQGRDSYFLVDSGWRRG